MFDPTRLGETEKSDQKIPNRGEAMDSSATQDVKEQVQEKAQEATDQVREKAQEATQQARGRVQEQVDQRTTQAGEGIASTAETVRRVGQSLREEGQDGPARAAEQAAERIDRAGQWLRESDAERMVRDVERFGRERPWAFALGGLALGFAAARVLKASSGDRYRQERSTGTSPSGDGHEPNGRAELPTTASTAAPAPMGSAAGTAPTTPLDPPVSG
jgi:hypothetical protein